MTTIALLEDEVDLREEVADFLGSRGHKVMQAGSLAEFAPLAGTARVAVFREAVGLGNRRLHIVRSGPFLTVFLAYRGAMGLHIRQELSSLGPMVAFGAPSPTAS